MDIAEINTTLESLRIGQRWWTKDGRVSYRKTKGGWEVDAFSVPVRKAFEEYGIIYQPAGTSSYEHTDFPSLKAARQAVSEVSLEAGLNIDSVLTRQKYLSYKIGGLPLCIKRQKSYWQVYAISSPLPLSLQKYFNSTKEFRAVWESADIALAHHPTRKAAHQAVINWFTQAIAKK